MVNVVVILDGLDSEGDVLQEEGLICFVDIEFGTLDGSSFHNIHRAANINLDICCSVVELYADFVVVFDHTDIEVFLHEGAIFVGKVSPAWILPLPTV